MQVLLNVIVVIQVVAALTMIGLVLIQHGKGADMGASFGSGSAGSLFGATGSANFLSRSTAVAAALFFCCTLALAYSANRRVTATESGTSVLDRAATVPVAASGASSPVKGAAQIPGGVSAVPSNLPAASEGASVPPRPAAVASAPSATASGATATLSK